MKPIVLDANDPRIGKVTEDAKNWPAVDITGAEYEKKAVSEYGLKNAPNGEHWFVVLPSRFDDGALDISVGSVKSFAKNDNAKPTPKAE